MRNREQPHKEQPHREQRQKRATLKIAGLLIGIGLLGAACSNSGSATETSITVAPATTTTTVQETLVPLATTTTTVGVTNTVSGTVSKFERVVDGTIELDPQQISDLIEQIWLHEGFTTIDLRNREQYLDGHLYNVVNVEADTETIVDRLSSYDKEAEYIIYTQTGIRNSELLKALAEDGFISVAAVAGGWENWQGGGQPWTTGE